jgi:hypothetical protein
MRGWIIGCLIGVTNLAIADAPDTLWTKTYGGTGGEDGLSVQECASGGFIIVGGTSSFGAGDCDVYLIRTDSNGDTLWTRTYGGTDREMGVSVQECTGGGFIITGETGPFGAGDVYLIRTDADGDTLWTKTYGGIDDDGSHSVQECAEGGFVIAGGTSSFGAGLNDVYLIRTDSNGDTLWTKTYGGTNPDYGFSVQECASGGFVIVGRTHSFGADSGNVYLIRVGAEEGVEEEMLNQVQHDNLLEVYPNPSLGNALIKYGLPERADISLGLYDISGRLVKSLCSGIQEKGYHEVNAGAYHDTPLPTGTYFIRLSSRILRDFAGSTGEFKATRKLTILR